MYALVLRKILNYLVLLSHLNDARVLEIREIGLMQYWDLLNHVGVGHHCQGQSGYQPPKSQPALSLKNLTGAFVILFVGIGLSLVAFFYEMISYYLATRNRDKRERRL